MSFSRRTMVTGLASVGAAAVLPTWDSRRLSHAGPAPTRARVVVALEPDREKAVESCLDALTFKACAGRDVAVKANFNSDDPFPASTHPKTLGALLESLKRRGAASLALGERSGMGDTRRVLERTGAAAVVQKAGGRVIVLDEVERDGWRPFASEYWPRGFHAARLFTEAPCVVQTMCCKTHRFGGHVTLALKNAVGVVAKHLPGDGHNFMRDLHSSDHQRAMIAEINLAWRPAVSIMDCLEAFIDGGPERGQRAAPGVFLASDDRCALDAAAIALLRLSGMRGPAARGPIASTAQLQRALALGLGAPPRAVEMVAIDARAQDVARRVGDALAGG